MATARLNFAKLVFGRIPNGQRRREVRFLLLAISLGLILSVAFGAVLYTLTQQGRL